MVQVTTSTRGTVPSAGYSSNSSSQGTPQIHVHFVHRDVFGNGIGIRSYGEIKMAAGEFIWAYELKLNEKFYADFSGNTLQVLLLTPEVSPPQTFNQLVAGRKQTGTPWKNGLAQAANRSRAIWRKGEYDNYASINIWDLDKNFQGAGTPPDSHLDGEEDNRRLAVARLYSLLRGRSDGLRRVVCESSSVVCAA